MKKFFKMVTGFAIAAMVVGSAGFAHASIITWDPSVDLFAGGANTSFVSQNGTFVAGFNGGAAAVTQTVGDTTFTALDNVALNNGTTIGGVTLTGNFTGSAGPTTFGGGRLGPDPTATALINSAVFQGTNLTLSGLTVGNTYEVQILVNDARGGGASVRDEEWQNAYNDGNGGTTITGIAQLNNRAFNDGADPANDGDFIIGTFVAAAGGTQSIDFIASRGNDPTQTLDLGGTFGAAQNFNAGQAQINAFQLREIAIANVVPEPGTASFLLGGLLIGFAKRRRK